MWLKIAWVLVLVWAVCFAFGHTFGGYIHWLLIIAFLIFIALAVLDSVPRS